MAYTKPRPFLPYEKFVVALLAFLQFTIILDFMILSPLGAMLMPALQITPSQFGLVVSAYAFSAGASGLLAAGFADRFDRKKLLIFFYSGFLVGTLLCGLAPTYHFLLAARVVTGIFGGVIGSIVLAITADLFPMEMRGRVMGIVQTAFAASQVMGIPIGLFLANHWGWHSSFLMIVAVGSAIGVVILLYLKPIDSHLGLQEPQRRNPFKHVFDTLSVPKHWMAFISTAFLTTGGFMLMPFSSAFTVNNLGINIENLPMVYMITGVSSMFAGPLLGRLSDSVGKYLVFCVGSVWMITVVSIYTRFGVTPLWLVILMSILMFIGISSRMISASALTSAIPDPKNRGSFMAVNSSIQQISGGIASATAGLIVVQTADGSLLHYDRLGNIVVTAMLVALVSMYFVNRRVHN